MTKIALISDIHFGKFSRTQDFNIQGEYQISDEIGGVSLKEELIKKLIEESINFLIVAGDLTSIGSPEEFFYCDEAIHEIASKSGIDPSNIVLCLGNHDIDWKISEISESYAINLREKIANSYLSVAGSVANHWMKDSFNYLVPGPAPFSGVKEFEDVIFISLNSGWLCSHDESKRQGKLNNKQLDWVKDVLAKYKESPKWKILVLHHHPYIYPYPIPCPDHSVLMEGPELIEALGKNGINIVCHGHRHHPRVKNVLENGWINPITFISSGSLSVNVAHRGENVPNIFHIIELEDSKSFYLRSYQFRSIDGWKEMSENNNYTPIDFEMFFKEPFTREIIDKYIVQVCSFEDNKNQKELVAWRNLPIPLKSLPLKDLNSALIKFCRENNIKIYGEFPQNVALLKE